MQKAMTKNLRNVQARFTSSSRQTNSDKVNWPCPVNRAVSSMAPKARIQAIHKIAYTVLTAIPPSCSARPLPSPRQD